MTTRLLDWARTRMRREESAFLQLLFLIPYFMVSMGLGTWVGLSGWWQCGFIAAFFYLLRFWMRTFGPKSEEEYLLLCWLLSLVAVPLGVLVLLAGVTLEAIEEDPGLRSMKLSGLAAVIVGVINVLLFQLYHRIVVRESETAGKPETPRPERNDQTSSPAHSRSTNLA